MAWELMVLYEWKPGTTPERIEHHFRKIRGLNGRVPGLINVRVGPRTLGFGPGWEKYTHLGIMSFKTQADYATFGRSAEHDEIAPELVADLANIVALGFTGTPEAHPQ